MVIINDACSRAVSLVKWFLFVGGHSLSLRSSVAPVPPQPLAEKGRSQDVPLQGKRAFSASPSLKVSHHIVCPGSFRAG